MKIAPPSASFRALAIAIALTLWLFAASVSRAADGFPIRDKTLVAWVSLSNLTQRGGSPLALDDQENHFDAIVFGEHSPARWMAGSDFWRRTSKEQAGYPVETADPGALVQIAIAYKGNQVTLYRNGKEYAHHEVAEPLAFGADTAVVIGLRHIQRDIAGFAGTVDDARLYNRALSAEEIASLEPHKLSQVKPLAWWTFEAGKAQDLMHTFLTSHLEGNAHIANGKLVLDGSGQLWATLDSPAPEAAQEPQFDAGVQTLFYKARSKRSGNTWDTWLFWNEGTYYLYYLASHEHWDNFSMASSPDGVHWKEIGPVLSKRQGTLWLGTGSTWKSPKFGKDGKYFLNFSEWRGPRQTIFFAESKDLIHWTRLGNEYEFVQDERWYRRNGRWDCIYTIPRPGGGLYGYWTATPKPETGGQFGFGESLDGITWKALAPPKVTGVGEGEVGGVEKIGQKYYMMFGTHGVMDTLVADRPEGPFQAARKNLELLAGHTYFSRFFPMPEGVLVNHHSIARDGHVYLGTLKATVVDGDGTLRLAWWKGNEKMKQWPINVQLLPRDEFAKGVTFLGNNFDTEGGIILEGALKLPASGEAPAVGLFIPQSDGAGSAVLVRAGGITEFGSMLSDGTGFKAEKLPVNREWKFGSTARFRLLLKGSLIEFYLDDLLMQCYSLAHNAIGQIGLISGGDSNAFKDLKTWQVEAPAPKPFTAAQRYDSPIHYRPKVGSVADTIPFFWKGQYHIIYLRAGFSHVPWEHIVSSDLIHWNELPSAIVPDGALDGPDGQDVGTGSVVEHDGTFHIFSTGINSRNKRGEQCIMHATSADLVGWTKHPEHSFYADDATYKNAGFRDPYVFWNDEAGAFWMILCAVDAKTGKWTQGVAQSSDLQTWKQLEPLAYDPPSTVAPECPDLFKIGDTWYMIYSVWYPKQMTGTTDVRFSKSIRGPYRLSPTPAIDTPLLYAAKRMFDGRRHVITGWIRDLGANRDDGEPQFGGDQCLPREVYAGPNGQLCFRPVPEATAQFNRVIFSSEKEPALNTLPTSIATPENYLFECNVQLERGADFTVAMRRNDTQSAGAVNTSGYRLILRSSKQEAELASSEFSHSRKIDIDFTRPVKIQAFVQGSIIECFIQDAYAFSCRAYNYRAGGLGISVTGGKATVTNVIVKTHEQ